MNPRKGEQRIPAGVWTAFMLTVVIGSIVLCVALFNGWFTSYVPVMVVSDRAGLVMETGAKVMMRGVQVGKVAEIDGQKNDHVSLKLDLSPDQIRYVPANVEAQITATTAFGAKYVDLVYPEKPSPRRLAANAVVHSRNVSTEVNTVFENLVDVINQIDVSKVNATLTALADGLRGMGPQIGEATTDANQVLLALNPRMDTVQNDWRSLRRFSDAYGAAAQNILKILNAVSTTSTTVANHADDLDTLLLSSVGFANTFIDIAGGANEPKLINGINGLAPTTGLLMKYNPEYTCMILGAKYYLDHGGYQNVGGNGRTLLVDAGLLLGDDPYKFPDNLPIVGAKGGPDGKPGCGSLPDVSKNFPARYVVTNTGWGTGLDVRPNPGIGFPGWADYFPVTRAVPEPPSIRYPGGPAPGPQPYPGAPAYGAQLYAPDGTPLWPGLPPAPPPGAPRDPGRTPGSEPFVVSSPAQMQPTPAPPLPEEAAPSP
jgi:phospholipid/cholesterol/gamma-HCH transport system substrate-binding protein